MGQWWVQLWGESLGKDGKGFTPVAAVGATDQHSLLQLLRDGPDDKITWFISVDEVPDPTRIPRAPLIPNLDLPTFQLLQSHTLAELLTVEYRATSMVLTKQRRPNITFQLDRLDERSIGALLFSMCVLTALTGTLMDVNPFDQPGVEEGKVYIRESLARSSVGAWNTEADDESMNPALRLRRQEVRESGSDS
jgi:glucose-6-phosphate isomerase